MALRTKTIEYAFPTNEAALALATRFDFAAITLYIPETASRTFRSVILEVYARDGATAAASMTSYVMGIKLGAVAFDNATVTTTMTNTGENQSWVFRRDVTSYFTTNFGAGASQTCQAGIQFGASATSNQHAKLIITYEFDDAAQDTRVKTVRIPLESNTGALTTTLASRGTTQIPDLDTFLPESTKTYRHVWFEVEGNEGTNSTTDTSLNLALDAEAADADAVHENALQSAVFYKRIWVRNDMTTSATHDFKAASSLVAGASYYGLTVTLYVTYEYSHTSSTSFMNSLILAMPTPECSIGPTSTNKSRVELKFKVSEPATVTLAQSAVRVYMSIWSTANLALAAGAQSARTYTMFGGNYVEAGDSCTQHRIDAGGAAGAGITLARGENTLTLDLYRATNPVTVTGIYVILNYTSGKATGGDGAHNHSTCWMIGQSNLFDTADTVSAAVAPNIPETNWHLTNMGAEAIVVGENARFGAGVMAAAGEASGVGLVNIMTYAGYNDYELGVNHYLEQCDEHYAKHSNWRAPVEMALETTRVWQFGSMNCVRTLAMWVTYHSIFDWSIAGTVTGYAGSGSGLTVDVFRADTDEKVTEITTGAAGAYSQVWHDNTMSLYAVCREDDTHIGRSANAVPA